MQVRTSYILDAAAEVVWPLLCDSTMELRPPFWFLLGIPQPRQCRLPGGAGGVGRARECVSDRGSIQQRILQWDPPRRLCFEMVRTDIRFLGGRVARIVDSFDLETLSPEKTRVTRTTQVDLVGRFRAVKAIAVRIGLNAVHRYVFANWSLLAQKSAG